MDKPGSFSSGEQREDKRQSTSLLKEGFTILTGATGLFVAVLWMVGRTFFNSFLSALNIDPTQVHLSIWEYAHFGWQFLIVFAVYTMFIIAIEGLVLSFLIGAVKAFWLARGWNEFKLSGRLGALADKVRKIAGLSPLINLWVLCIFFAVFLWLLVNQMNFARDIVERTGSRYAREFMIFTAPQIDLVSDTPLSLEVNTGLQSVESSENTNYVYHGYRLLMYNEGKYYFYKEIDIKTCRPKQVFVVDEKRIVQLSQLSTISFQLTNCSDRVIVAPTVIPPSETVTPTESP